MHLPNGNLKNESWQRSFTSQAFQIPDKKNSPNFFLQAKLKYFQHFSSKIASRLEHKREKENTKRERKSLRVGKKKNMVSIFPLFQEQVIEHVKNSIAYRSFVSQISEKKKIFPTGEMCIKI
jgi:hypothetical protein